MSARLLDQRDVGKAAPAIAVAEPRDQFQAPCPAADDRDAVKATRRSIAHDSPPAVCRFGRDTPSGPALDKSAAIAPPEYSSVDTGPLPWQLPDLLGGYRHEVYRCCAQFNCRLALGARRRSSEHSPWQPS